MFGPVIEFTVVANCCDEPALLYQLHDDVAAILFAYCYVHEYGGAALISEIRVGVSGSRVRKRGRDTKYFVGA